MCYMAQKCKTIIKVYVYCRNIVAIKELELCVHIKLKTVNTTETHPLQVPIRCSFSAIIGLQALLQ